jgi:hypothetical protein
MVRTMASGYAFTRGNPRGSALDLESLVPGLDPTLVAAELSALEPAFAAPDGTVGELNPARLRAWAAWEARFAIVSRPPDVAKMFDPGFAAGVRSVAG